MGNFRAGYDHRYCRLVAGPFSTPFRSRKATGRHTEYMVGICGNILDLPFSAVGDTVTLPITIPYSIHRLITKPDESPHDFKGPQPQLDLETQHELTSNASVPQ